MRATITGSEFSARLGDKRMLMSDITSAVRRRWVLALVCLALILAATVAAVQRSGPTYQSHATVLLVPPHISSSQPTSGPDYTQGNPLFYLGALEQTRDVLIGSLTSRRTQAELGSKFPGSTYGVAPDLLNSAAVLELTVGSNSAAETTALLEALTQEAPQSLALVQDGLRVPGNARITSQVLAKDASPTVSHKGQIRLGIEVAAALALLSLFLIAGIDSILRTRRRRHDDAVGDDPEGGEMVEPDEMSDEEHVSEVRPGVAEAPAAPSAAEPTTPSVVRPDEPDPAASPTAPEGPAEEVGVDVAGEAPEASDDAAGKTDQGPVQEGPDEAGREGPDADTSEPPLDNVRSLVKVPRGQKPKRRIGGGRPTTSSRGRARSR